jgi:hypothetical protein
MPKITNIAPGFDIEDVSSGKIDEISKEKSEFEKKVVKNEPKTPSNKGGRKTGYFIPQQKEQQKKILVIITAVVAILFTLWVFLVKSGKIQSRKIMKPSENGSSLGGRKVEADLTGEMFSEENSSWSKERPFAVMVNNHTDARPQSGLIYADLVYEIVAEGGITRFLAFFQTNTPEKIGPVRSTREYYLVLVKELGDAMLMHIGYSPQALVAIDTWPVRSLFRGGCESVQGCTWRDNPRNVAYEHTAYTNGEKLRELGISLGWEGKGDIRVYKFKDDENKYSSKPSANKISIDFWNKGDYSSVFEYNQGNNTYLKFTGYDSSGNPIPHKDQEETDKQVEVKNLIVQFAVENSIVGDDKGRLDYQLVGSGKALVFIDGKVIEATWSKAERDDRTLFYDTDGNEIEFNRGKFWIAIVPDRNVEQVVYN